MRGNYPTCRPPHLPNYRGTASVRTWLYRIAHNVASVPHMRLVRPTVTICSRTSSWRSGGPFRITAARRARTWLYRIAHNVALTWQGRHRRRHLHEAPLIEDVDASTDMDLRRLALKRAIAQMNPVDRSVTVLWLEGLSAAEIEQVTGIKASTVAVRLSRIRKQLRPAGLLR